MQHDATGRCDAAHTPVASSNSRVRILTRAHTRNAIVHNAVLDPGIAFLAKPFTLSQFGEESGAGAAIGQMG